MAEPNSRAFKGVWIPKEIWTDKNLTIQEKHFLCEIDSLDNEQGCFATNAYFAEFFGLSKKRVSVVINELIRKKYITSRVEYKEGTKEISKRVLKVSGIPLSPKSGSDLSPESGVPIPENGEDNNTINNTKKNNTKGISPEIVEFVKTFQEYVSETHGVKAPKVTDSLLRNGQDVVDKLIRLDGFTLEQVRNSLRWAVKDDFWSKNVLSLASLRKKSRNNDLTKMQNIYASWERNAGQGAPSQGPAYITDQTDLYGNGN